MDQVTSALDSLRPTICSAKKYPDRVLQFLDLIQEGNIGLMKVVARYSAPGALHCAGVI